VERLKASGADLLVQMQHDLGIRAGGESMALGLEYPAQLDVVEDFAVEHNPQRAVLVRDWLLSRCDVDNREPGAAESNALVEIDAELIRTAVADGAEHRAKNLFARRTAGRQVDNAGDATHGGQLRAARRSLPDAVRGR